MCNMISSLGFSLDVLCSIILYTNVFLIFSIYQYSKLNRIYIFQIITNKIYFLHLFEEFTKKEFRKIYTFAYCLKKIIIQTFINIFLEILYLDH
jgi:hypothetical protein